MKSIKKIFFLLIVFSVSQVWGQIQIPLHLQNIELNDTLSWVEMMDNPNANFYDIQKAFYSYWSRQDFTKPNATKGKGFKPFKRWEAFMEQRVYPSGNRFDPSIVEKEYQKFIEKYPSGKSNNGNWVFLGPTRPGGSIPNGSYQSPGGNGRVNCITFDPGYNGADNQIIWIGTPSGGLWKTTNNGATWWNNSDQISCIGVSQIVIDPVNPLNMWIATGDGEVGDTYSTGILKSTDGGITWSSTAFSVSQYNNYRITRLLMDPTNPLIQIASCNGITYRTTDGWTTKITVSDLSGIIINDMEFKPESDGLVIYAVGVSSKVAKFYISTNRGQNFTLSGAGLPTSDVSRVAIAVSQAAPNKIYALAGKDSDQGFLGFYTSNNSGSTFSVTFSSTQGNLLGWQTNFSDAGGQAWYDLSLQVNPYNANEIFLGGVNLQKSTNGGVSWTCNAYWLRGLTGYQYAHADHHAIEYAPGSSTTLFDGNDGGIFMTENNGATWKDISNDLGISQVACIGISKTNPGLIMTGMQDNGSNMLSNNEWTVVKGGDGCEAMVDPSDEKILFCSYVNGTMYRSIDGGVNWTTTSTTAGGWITPYIMDPNNRLIMYKGSYPFNKSTNNGATWSTTGVTNPTGINYYLNSLAMSANNSNIIYAANIAQIWKSSNAGSSWTSIIGTLPVANAAISSVNVSPDNANHITVTFSGYVNGEKVYRSTDGGTTWTNISGNLPNYPVNCVVYEKGNANYRVYIGTDRGVFYGDNTSNNWTLFSNGLPNVVVKELEIFYGATSCDHKIRAATYGRGVWESDLLNSNTVSYVSSTVTQNNTTKVPLNAISQEVIGIKVVMSNCGNAVNLTSFELNTNGTTSVTDISNARIYYTGGLNDFMPIQQFGNTVASPSGTFIISGIQPLAAGNNYFWLTYDLPVTATPNNFIDAECTRITVNGNNYVPSVTAPEGSRQINDALSIGNGEDISYNYGPVYRLSASSTSDYSRHCYLITANEMNQLGIQPNSVITRLAFYKTNSAATTGNAIFNIYLKNTTATSLTTGTTWSSIITDATQVYASNTTTIPYQEGWVEFNLSLNSFVYTGNAIMIAVDWNISGVAGNPTTGPFYWKVTLGYPANYTIGSSGTTSAPTTLSTTIYGGTVRPNMLLAWNLPCQPPTVQASEFSYAEVTQSSLTALWKRGSGDGVIVVAKQGSAVDKIPVLGTSYTANRTFGSGSNLGSGNYVVYIGSGNSVNVTGLAAETGYYFAIFEYYSSGNCYKTRGPLTGVVYTHGKPKVTTLPVTYLTSISASSGGNVISVCGSYLVAKGICWSTSSNPTISDQKTNEISQGLDAGTFTSQITNLQPNTTYYVRAYATNAYGTSYGDNRQFKTLVSCNPNIFYPYTEEFENSGVIPDCWSENYVTGSTSFTFPTGGVSGYCAKFIDATANNSTRLISKPLDLSLASSAQLTLSYQLIKSGAKTDKLIVYYKTSSGGSLTQLASYTASTTGWTTISNLNLTNFTSNYYIVFEAVSNGGGGVWIDNVNITCSQLATISVSKTSLGDFGYVSLNNASNVRSFSLNGVGLTGNINITPPAGFEISLNNTNWYNSTLTLTPSSGKVNETIIFVRYYPTAEGASGTLSITSSSSGAATKSVTVSGTGTTLATGTWLGNNTTWSDETNWVGGTPTSQTNIIIPALAFQPVLANAGTCNNLTVYNGASLTLNNSLSVTGNVINNGTITGAGELIMNSLSAQQISGTIGKLIINNPAGVILNADTRINSSLKLNNGNLTIGNNHLTIGSSASLVGKFSNTTMIITNGSGLLKKEFSSIGSFTFPVGDQTGITEYSPATLNFTSGTFSSAWAGIKVVNAKHTENTSSSHFISRYWTVNQSGISDFSCQVSLQYCDNDITGTEELIYCKKYDGTWLKLNAADAANNLLTGTVIGFSDFTGGDDIPLPIELIAFNGYFDNGQVILKWTTLSETDNDYFTIERSADGIDFVSLGQIPGAGNSYCVNDYQFTDTKPLKVIAYYRLRQTDYNGKYAFSKVISVDPKHIAGDQLFELFPNPVDNQICFTGYFTGETSMSIYSTLGKICLSKTFLCHPQSSHTEIDVHHLDRGVYIVVIQIAQQQYFKKIYKN